MRNGYVVLVLALLLAMWRLQTPAPLPLTAPAGEFSAARAFDDIRAIAQRPHPVGTPDHARVRAYLVQRLAAMGLEPEQQSERITASLGATISAPVTNVWGVLRGMDPAKPALLIMSHYDSVPDSPGAADDTTGVAASLEIVRALKAQGVPARDVIVLFTDGEELGLMGATAFFRHNVLARHVGAVINFEARGDAGLAAMFETGPRNADTVAMYAARATQPSANSLSRVIYKAMPNGSDLSVAIARGLPALNFAFIDDEAAYHSPLSTPAHLDAGSVQHIGEQGLAAAQAFAAALPAQTHDAVYSDVLGFFVIEYSFLVGWVLFALAAALALYGIWAAQKIAPASWGRGMAAAVTVIVVPALLLVAAGYSFAGIDHFLRLAHFDFLLAGSAAIAVGAVALIAALFSRGREPALWQVLLLVLLVLSGVVQLLVPEAAFTLVWAVLIAGLLATVRFGLYRGRDGVAPRAICGVLALILLAQTMCAAEGLFAALGVDMPVLLMMPLLSVVPVVLLLPEGRRLPLWSHAAVLLAGVALFAYGRFAPPTPERPAPVLVRHVADLDSGKAWRVAYLNRLDPWTRAALGSPRQEALPWSDGKVWQAPAKPAAVPTSGLTIRREGAQLVITAKPAPGAYSAVLTVRASEPLGPSLFEGEKIGTIEPGERHTIRYYSPDAKGFSWRLQVPAGNGTLEAKLNTLYLSWPKDAAPLPPLPADRMAFDNSATTETVTRRTWKP